MLARIHISSNNDLMDENVYVDVEIPYPLPVGSSLYLKEESLAQLKKMATANRKVARNYFPDWFFPESSDIDHFEDADLNDIDFGDAMIIRYVSYQEGKPFVDIELESYEDYQSKEDELKQMLIELLRPQRQAAQAKLNTSYRNTYWKFSNHMR